MTSDIVLMFTILGTAILLFVVDWLRVYIVALLILLALIPTGLITPAEALPALAARL